MGRGHGGSRGGGGASGFQGDRTMSGYSAGLAKAMTAREEEIRGLQIEHLSIFDDNGNELFRNVGTGTHVQSSPEHEPNHIVTHNHPSTGRNKGQERSDGGGSLSKQDILGSIDTNAKEIRAVTKNRTYSLKRPKEGWVQGGWKGDKFLGNNANNYRKAKETVDKRDKAYYKGYKGDRATAARRMSSTYWHRVNKEFASRMGYEYTSSRVN